ncbi:endothelin-3 isoform X1 [Solea solea]|uniref:endothelin-3 isoform X1 n=1 Tax=Solea solea TaxID=90069 RepID=UPI00272B8554|nr:endothelin-3 isoform X1 [Solea solea]
MANISLVDVGVLLLIVVTATLANGFLSGKDVNHRKEVEEAKLDELMPGDNADDLAGGHTCAACEASRLRRRAKRCTCYSYKDKECVYYCHLDIIWINTPEHTVPYGVSSYAGSLRMRRSAGIVQQRKGAQKQRCVCEQRTDSNCSHFCIESRQRRPPQIDKMTARVRSGPAKKHKNGV